jgi:hypothetical protein
LRKNTRKRREKRLMRASRENTDKEKRKRKGKGNYRKPLKKILSTKNKKKNLIY